MAVICIYRSGRTRAKLTSCQSCFPALRVDCALPFCKSHTFLCIWVLTCIHVCLSLQQAQAAAGGPSGAKRGSGTGGSKDPLGISDFWWDAAGWVLLVAGIGAIALVARGSGGAPAAPTKA